MSFLAGEDAVCSVSDFECEDSLKKLKEGMMKAFDYSQGMDTWLHLGRKRPVLICWDY